jgi:flagellar motor component MotA
MRNSYVLQGFSISCLFAGVVSISTNQSTFISLALFSLSGICMFASVIYDSFTSAENHTNQEIQHVYNLINQNQDEGMRNMNSQNEEMNRQIQKNDENIREIVSNLEKENQKIMDHIIERIDTAFDELHEVFDETGDYSPIYEEPVKPKVNRKK